MSPMFAAQVRVRMRLSATNENWKSRLNQAKKPLSLPRELRALYDLRIPLSTDTDSLHAMAFIDRDG